MNSFILLMFFVVQFQLFTCDANNTSNLGILPCMYAGDYDLYGYYCSKTPMAISSLPVACTSFIYDGINFDSKFNVLISEKDRNNIINLYKFGKPLYLYIGYANQSSWINVTKKSNYTALKVLDLKTHLNGYNVTGLILKDLNYDPSEDGNFDETFYENLKQYVTVLKRKSAFSEVGLYVNATYMIYYSHHPNNPYWFKFDEWMNDLMDFYIIGFYKFNPCNDQFKDGIVPLYNTKFSNNSLTTFANVLKNSTIAKDKIYLEFSACPTPNDTTIEYLPTCAVTFEKFCTSDHYNVYWCADNSQSFFQKGRFARDLPAKGIVTKYIDTIDPTAKCQCDNNNEYITFTMMLTGFLSQDPVRNCPLLS
ncbi:uncharacterized protein LOC112602905 [Melanaphis sacchari]|uniref:uncharacterized protein LOC112602905 n=1 Tax=Melanaphis sacchari TaxID=742174 RepID=UPI000DC1511D|nr:uncharacterized protein LOC112602905 [Melanaphis sacchari]